MVSLIDFKKCAIEKYNEAEKQVKLLTDLEKQGIISDRFKRYCNQMLMLECLSEEAEAFALHDDLAAVEESLLEMKKFLIGIRYNYALDIIKKPKLRNSYQELCNLAQERYRAAFNKLFKIIERGII